LGEETGSEAGGFDETAANRLSQLLDESQSRLDALRMELAETVERHKRISQQGQALAEKAQALDRAVDAALQQGQDDRAADLLRQAQQARAQAQDLDELRQACEQLATQIRAAVESRQEQLIRLRSRMATLTDRERTAEALESLLKAQRVLDDQAEDLSSAFHLREEQITRREDRLSARQEWSQ